MKASRITLALIALLVLVVGGLAAQNYHLKERISQQEADRFQPQIGDTAPIFLSSSIDGRQVRIGEPQNKIQVLYFFASGCPACRRSAPYVREIAATYERAGVEFIALTPEAPSANLDTFVAQHKFKQPVVANFNGRLARALKLRMTPTLVVVNAQGNVEYVKVGAILSNKDAFGVILSTIGRDAKVLSNGGAG